MQQFFPFAKQTHTQSSVCLPRHFKHCYNYKTDVSQASQKNEQVCMLLHLTGSDDGRREGENKSPPKPLLLSK